MNSITQSVRIEANKQQVWDVLADFGGTYRYNPNVVRSFSTTEENGGVGAARHCDLTFGGASVDEVIVDWNEGTSYVIEIVDGHRTPPFDKVLATLTVDGGATETTVGMTFDYSMKYGPVGALMDRMVVRKQYFKAIKLILAGLKHYVETGEEVSNGVRVDTAAVSV